MTHTGVDTRRSPREDDHIRAEVDRLAREGRPEREIEAAVAAMTGRLPAQRRRTRRLVGRVRRRVERRITRGA